MDPVIRAVADTLRYISVWLRGDALEDQLLRAAREVDFMTPENDLCCPVCEETTCDLYCPLRPIRQQWLDEAIASGDFLPRHKLLYDQAGE
jgi:hypothetical protein